MLWDDDTKPDEVTIPDDVVDVSFHITCKQIPTTHAWELQQALYLVLPWLKDDTGVGIHQIHGATTGNGWERPADGELIYLSKRSRMQIRANRSRLDAINELVGETLNIKGYEVEVGEPQIKSLIPSTTLFARYVAVPADIDDENAFIEWLVDELKQKGISVRKMLCGISHIIPTPDSDMQTRSVMIADLDKLASVHIQQEVIGRGHHLGCGLFMPHKGIAAVGETEDKSHFSGT